MADVTDEIDEFAIFKARSLGAESEYLVLAKAGQLRGRDTRTASDSEDKRGGGHWSGTRQQRNILSGRCGIDEDPSQNSPREDSCSPKGRRGAVPPYARSDSAKTMTTLDTRNAEEEEEEEREKGRLLHRTHSYRSRRSSPQPQSSQLALHSLHGAQSSESKLNRSRTMTMPTRRRPTMAAAAGGKAGSHSPSSPGGPGGDQPVMDRAVLRVRNFSTKSGNIVVNRGDSIKVRGGRSEFRSSGSLRSSGGGGGGGGGTPRGSRPPSAKDEANGAVVHGNASPSPSISRPSLSRHSSRGSCKIYADPEFVSSSPADGGGWGATGADQTLTGSTPSAHNLLSPIGYQVNDEGQAPDDDPQVSTHLQVFSDCDQRGPRSRSTLKVDPGADEEVAVYKVLVLGSQGVGKTTLTKQLLTSEYLANNDNDIDDETADRIVSVQVDDEESMLQFVDSEASGGTQPSKDRDSADANLVVYSVTDRTSFTFAHTCLQELRPAKRHNVVILVGNKQDIVRNRIISEEDGKNLAAKRHCKFIEVSALLNHKTDDLLVGITRQIRLRKARGTNAASAGTGGRGGGRRASSPVEEGHGGPIGCLQKVAIEAFRKIFRRRPIEATSCDDLFTP